MGGMGDVLITQNGSLICLHSISVSISSKVVVFIIGNESLHCLHSISVFILRLHSISVSILHLQSISASKLCLHLISVSIGNEDVLVTENGSFLCLKYSTSNSIDNEDLLLTQKMDFVASTPFQYPSAAMNTS